MFNMIKIAVPLAEGFEEIEAITIIDVLRRAEIAVTIVSITENLAVNGSHNITILADQLFEEVNFDIFAMIVLPGGIPGVINLKNHIGLQNQIMNFNKEEKPLAAICAAPLVFGNLGILEGKTATCYPGFEDQLLGAEVTSNKVELSDNIITAKGAGVAIEFALKIVEILKGKVIAAELAKKMIFE